MSHKFEQSLIDLCSPTLAGIKVGSVFLYTIDKNENLHKTITYWNMKLSKKGLHICLIKERYNGGLVYVFRPAMLNILLTNKEIKLFLQSRGFKASTKLEVYIEQLQYCFYNKSSFPHEIGIFLGYPLKDVKGFIEHSGKNFTLCGFWKVYGEPKLAQKMFSRYQKCLSIYKQIFEKNYDILYLTVTT